MREAKALTHPSSVVMPTLSSQVTLMRRRPVLYCGSTHLAWCVCVWVHLSMLCTAATALAHSNHCDSQCGHSRSAMSIRAASWSLFYPVCLYPLSHFVAHTHTQTPCVFILRLYGSVPLCFFVFVVYKWVCSSFLIGGYLSSVNLHLFLWLSSVFPVVFVPFNPSSSLSHSAVPTKHWFHLFCLCL